VRFVNFEFEIPKVLESIVIIATLLEIEELVTNKESASIVEELKSAS
jgi:hypothetical protein